MHRSQTQGERVPESGGQKSTLVFNFKITGRARAGTDNVNVDGEIVILLLSIFLSRQKIFTFI